jgi:hypothetical protein
MLSGRNIHYDFDGRYSGISCGGIGIIHQMVQSLGLPEEINSKLELLKRHLPYHESDHILNIVFNILAGGTCLEDIELLRNNEPYLNALGAQIIPDPTTAGDFLRRFSQEDIILLMDIVNDIRKIIWLKQSQSFKKWPLSMLMAPLFQPLESARREWISLTMASGAIIPWLSHWPVQERPSILSIGQAMFHLIPIQPYGSIKR